MTLLYRFRLLSILAMIATAGLGCDWENARASQNSAWTVTRAASLPTYRVVAYGDSIFSGYVSPVPPAENADFAQCGTWGGFYYGQRKPALRAAPYVAGEYLSHRWNANIEVVRRTRAGAKAVEIVNKLNADAEFMKPTSARAVMVEMCGNDFLWARKALSNKQSGTCDEPLTGLHNALAECELRMTEAVASINDKAGPHVQTKIIMNLYYPGYDQDNRPTRCTDANGQSLNLQDTFLDILARSNWRACHLAEEQRKNGVNFQCADAFAQMMGADHDSNGDGQMDSEALRYREGEREDAYVHRITNTLRDTVRDANAHQNQGGDTADYVSWDNVHPTYLGEEFYVSGGDLWRLPIGCDGVITGSSIPEFSDSQMVNGKNPVWNKWGHERLGWEISQHLPASP